MGRTKQKPAQCCIPGCQSVRDDSNTKVSFYQLPANDTQCALWIQNIPRDWKAEGKHDPLLQIKRKSTYVCSLHFVSKERSSDPDDVDYVPTVFEQNSGTSGESTAGKCEDFETILSQLENNLNASGYNAFFACFPRLQKILDAFVRDETYQKMGMELTFKSLPEGDDEAMNSTAAVFIQHLCAEHARGFAIDRHAFLPVPNLLKDVLQTETVSKAPVASSKAVLSVKRTKKSRPVLKTSSADYPGVVRDALKTIDYVEKLLDAAQQSSSLTDDESSPGSQKRKTKSKRRHTDTSGEEDDYNDQSTEMPYDDGDESRHQSLNDTDSKPAVKSDTGDGERGDKFETVMLGGKLKTRRVQQCQYCDFATPHKYSFIRHQITQHPTPGETKYVCKICCQILFSKEGLETHMKNQHTDTATCTTCGKTYTSKRSLRIHIQVKHTLDTAKYACTICDKKFHQKHHFEGHMDAHAGLRRHKCLRCGNSYAYSSSFHKHKCKGKKKKKRFPCDKCGLEFARKAYLNEHMIGKHSGKVPYHCEHCNTGFTWRGSWKNHANWCKVKRAKEEAAVAFQGPVQLIQAKTYEELTLLTKQHSEMKDGNVELKTEIPKQESADNVEKSKGIQGTYVSILKSQSGVTVNPQPVTAVPQMQGHIPMIAQHGGPHFDVKLTPQKDLPATTQISPIQGTPTTATAGNIPYQPASIAQYMLQQGTAIQQIAGLQVSTAPPTAGSVLPQPQAVANYRQTNEQRDGGFSLTQL